MAKKITTDFMPIGEVPASYSGTKITTDFTPVEESEPIPTSKFQLLKRDLKENALPIGGMMIGGVLGGLSPVPGGSIAGAGAGAGAGQIIKEAITPSPTRSVMNKPQEAQNSYDRVATQVMSGMVSDIGGKAITWLGGKLLAPYTKRVSDAAMKDMKILERYLPKKDPSKKDWVLHPLRRLRGEKSTTIPPLLYNEITKGEADALGWITNFSEGSIFGGQFRVIRRQREKYLTDAFDDILQAAYGKNASLNPRNPGLDPYTLGNLVLRTVKGSKNFSGKKVASGLEDDFSDMVTSPLYNRVKELMQPKMVKKTVFVGKEVSAPAITKAGGKLPHRPTTEIEVESPIMVDISDLKAFVQPKLKVSEALGAADKLQRQTSGSEVAELINGLDNKVPYEVADELRKRLLLESREIERTVGKTEEGGMIKQLSNKLHDNITAVLGKENPEALELWQFANSLYKFGSQRYNNAMLKSLVKLANPDIGTDNAEKIIETIFKSRMGTRTIKRAISPITPQESEMLAGTLGAKASPETRQQVVEAMRSIYEAKNTMGEKTWNKLEGYWLRSCLQKSLEPIEEHPDWYMVNPWKLEKAIYGKFGQHGVRAIVNPETERALGELITVLKRTQGKHYEGGKMFGQLTSGSAMLNVGSYYIPAALGLIGVGGYNYDSGYGQLALTGGSLMIGLPLVASRLMTNPTGIKWLTQGLLQSAKQPTRKAVQAAATLGVRTGGATQPIHLDPAWKTIKSQLDKYLKQAEHEVRDEDMEDNPLK